MKLPNLRLWGPFRHDESDGEPMDLDEMGTAFGLDESLRDAAEPVPHGAASAAHSEDDEAPFAWLARRGLRPQR